MSLKSIALTLLLCFGLWIDACEAQTDSIAPAATTLNLSDALSSVTTRYPPYLAALISRDVASGRLRAALGAFDLQLFVKTFTNPTGFYESTTVEAGFEQFLGWRGLTVFGGYQYTEGDLLPDYYYDRRTNAGGTPNVGLRLPLLKGGAIDEERARIGQARLGQEIVEPAIRKLSIEFGASAMRTYYKWLGAGQKLAATESMLQVAEARNDAIQSQVDAGLLAPITLIENRQSILTFETAVLAAQQEFQTAALALSLFYRDQEEQPVIVQRAQLPHALPEPIALQTTSLTAALDAASSRRPEFEEYALKLSAMDIDLRLALNKTMPKLDAYLRVGESLGRQLYKDTGELEVKLGVEFEIPLQRREARGKVESTEAKIAQIETELRFTLDKLLNETRGSFLAMELSRERYLRASENADLTRQLRDVEADRFRAGASDFLDLQIREQNSFKAQLDKLKAQVDYFESLAAFLAATAVDFGTEGATPEILLTQALGAS